MLEWDCDRLIRNDRVIWASCMVACNDADAMSSSNRGIDPRIMVYDLSNDPIKFALGG